jgi:hypothetical protein
MRSAASLRGSCPETGGAGRGIRGPALQFHPDRRTGGPAPLLPLGAGQGLRTDDPTEGIRPPRREPYARARGLSAEEVARLLAVIPGESAAGLGLRTLVWPTCSPAAGAARCSTCAGGTWT